MIFVLLAFLAGLLIGSFLNVCIFRLPRDLSVVTPARSFCPECEKTIAWYDNIPVISYLVLGGRCRDCKARIPVRYLLVEIATGAAFAVCVAYLGLTLPALKYAIYSAIMITLIASDLEERILPDEFTLGGTLVGLAFSPFVFLERYFAAMFIPFSAGERWQSFAESAFAAAVGRFFCRFSLQNGASSSPGGGICEYSGPLPPPPPCRAISASMAASSTRSLS